jgi:TolB protein
MKIVRSLQLALVSFAFFAVTAHAQLRVEVSGVGATQIPIAVAAFADESISPEQITTIIKDDLNRSTYFKLIDAPVVLSETSAINYDEWRLRGAQALVIGSVQKLSDGKFDVRYRLLDTIKASSMSGFSLVAAPANLRNLSHRIADDIYQKLTGIRGVFATRIAFVEKNGSNYVLAIADADGANVVPLVKASEPIISPSFSPDGSRIAFVSFDSRKPVVKIKNILTGALNVVANFKGSNSSPAWAPDGNRLAIALSRDGQTQLYSINADGSGVQRLVVSSGIDTEPQYSPDGQYLYFLSDRSGGPQIYRMPATGGEAKRITFAGSYNTTPRISPDGKTMAFISRREGKFQLFIQDLESGQEYRLSDTAKDESPSFSPNGKYILYATDSGRSGSLAIATVDGGGKAKLTVQAGDIREPTWGPYSN